MKIIGIVGIADLPGSENRIWKNIRTEFLERFPGTEFVIEHALYAPWNRQKMRLFAERLNKKYGAGGEELLLVGYSLGGVIACALAEKLGSDIVKLVVTIDAPHDVPIFYRWLGARREVLPMPILTFTSALDPVVPWFLTSYPASVHTTFIADHYFGLVVGTRLSKIMASKAAAALTH